MKEEMMESMPEPENDMESGLKEILASNDIQQIHSIAQGMLKAPAEEPKQPKKNFVDQMVEMHKMSKQNPKQEMEE